MASGSREILEFGLPVSTACVPSNMALFNDDGTDAEMLEFGVICRKVRGMSGQIRNQYLDTSTSDENGDIVYRVITDIDEYNTIRSNLDQYKLGRQIQEEFANQELGNTPEQFRNTGGGRTGRKHNISADSSTTSERLDKEIDRSIRSGTMIRLDEAFPDVGIYEGDSRSLPTSPAVRARQAALHGGRYQREYILRTVHRLTLRRVPIDQIAQMFNVQVNTVYSWIEELRERLKAEASTMSIAQIAGDTLAFYNEARALGLTIASTAEKIPDRIRGMEVALKSEQDKHKFLQVAGFYDTAKLGRDNMEDESAKKAQQIINMTKSLLSGKYDEVDELDSVIDADDRVII